MVQGLALVTFPAASAIFTNPQLYALSKSEYGAMFVPQATTAVTAALLGAGLTRRLGVRRIYLVGLAADLLSMALLFASRLAIGRGPLEYPMLLGATASLGIGFGLTVPALNTLVAAFFPAGVDRAVLVLNAIQVLEAADAEPSAAERASLLTVVVAGGGFSGVETVGAVNDFLRGAQRFYRHLVADRIRIVLVHAGALILPELGDELGAYAQRKLAQRGVEVLLHTTVKRASERGVELGTGETIPASTLVWTAGISANPLVAALPCAKQRGRIVVDASMAVPGHPGVWALGDCAVVPDPRSGRPYPPTAQHAVRQGRVLARNLRAAIRGGPARPFVFDTLGLLAAIGARTGVARILGRNFSGVVAWWLWRTIYLAKLPTLQKRVRVALDWTADLFFPRDIVQFETVRETPISEGGDAAAEYAPAPLPAPAPSAPAPGGR